MNMKGKEKILRVQERQIRQKTVRTKNKRKAFFLKTVNISVFIKREVV